MTVTADPTPIVARIDTSVGRTIDWLTTMLPAADGSEGIWERIRIDVAQVVRWVRPDCTAEARGLFARAAVDLGRPELAVVARGLGSWLLANQHPDGSFPFYTLEGIDTSEQPFGQGSTTRYPNDHGKVLEMLSLWSASGGGDEVTAAADRLAAWIAGQQNERGWFPMDAHDWPGPCMVAWPVAGLARHAANGGPGAAVSSEAARRSVSYLAELQGSDGRIRTTYEIHQRENWRPASSETSETLRAFALSQRLLDIDLTSQIAGATRFLGRLTTDEGAIRNCDETCADASEQNDGSLTDLVYTCGYALHAWLDAWRLTGEAAHLDAARRLGEYLMSIQVDDPSVAWNGAWRGSYDVDQQIWRGRANQHNPIDEGGEFSVYTGWCNATIANGLLRLRAALLS